MHAIQQRCRPKHQVLVLKCYPRTTKGAVDVKPNSSELSYLLYYATSRRTKIQKVGSFLERKTASDVWRLRIGNVQVTLQILEALIEKNPKDLPLFAPNVLKIFDLILRSNDITMVESSIPTFEAFCSNHDASTLLGDQFYLSQFEAIVRHYASLASTRSSPGKTQPSKPVAMRWRSAGLDAIRAVASSDSLSTVAGRQYDMMVPMILENLWTDNEAFLDVLLHRAEMAEKVDADRMLKRRTSIATVRTADTAGDTNPLALSGTATDVDKVAEEDIGVLAMLCLKQVFITPSRSLIHYATMALLEFVKDRIDQGEAVVHAVPPQGHDAGWALKICGLLLRWAPVQERYIILVTVVDALARAPLSDDTLDQHIALTAMSGSLLRSDASLIGLSVMDVLLGFIQHIKKLVQMPGDPAAAAAAASSAGPPPGQPDPRSPTTLAAIDSVATVASKRKELLARLQQCIGDLATHVYYADQIADMVSAILFRLKPPRTSSGTPPGEKADEKTDEAAEAPQKSQQPQQQHVHQHPVDSLFSLTVAKTAALRAIKAILLVANPKTKVSSNQTLSRNRVPIQVWEGTHWLLRDPDGAVRKAYVDAILAWLDRETTRADQQARDDSTISSSSSATAAAVTAARPTTRSGGGPPTSAAPVGAATLARRAVSSASNRESGAGSGSGTRTPPGRRRRVFFLSLLHLAVFDNALQYVDYETDIVLLHVLLFKLVDRLGVNVVRYGLPMIFQLQEAIQDVETPQAKVRVGSLVHGYFWTLTEKFQFEASVVGRAIRNEITRRRSKHFWVEGVHVPPPLLELVGTPGMSRPLPKMPLHEIESEALLPFDDRLSLIECICTGYHESSLTGSPPQSPTASPGRGLGSGGGGGGSGVAGGSSFNFGTGGLTSGAGGGAAGAAGGRTEADTEVPAVFKDQMLSDWSRDGVLQAVQQYAGSKSVSLNGSRTGTMATNNAATTGGRHRLATVSSNSNNNNNSNNDGVAGAYSSLNGNGLSPSASQQNIRAAANASPRVGRSGSAAGDNNIQQHLLSAPPQVRMHKSSVRSGVSLSPGGSMSSRGDAGGRRTASGSNDVGGHGFVTSVDQLKMALTGAPPLHNVDLSDPQQGLRHQQNQQQQPMQQQQQQQRRLRGEPLSGDDDSSDSMVSYDMSASEFSFNPPPAPSTAAGPPSQGGPASESPQQPQRPVSQQAASGPETSFIAPSAKQFVAAAARRSFTSGEFNGPLKSNPVILPPSQLQQQHDGATNGGAVHGGGQPNNEDDDAVPPVPPLPSPLVRQHQFQQAQQAQQAQQVQQANAGPKVAAPAKSPGLHATRRSLKSRGGDSILSTSFSENNALQQPTPTMDLQSLLKGIDSRASEHTLGNLSQPPY
ncbi:protein efr3 [Niveomyces insectorum RCEF 264]|uniref:Protein efr3 n=1 Tax=Niveomyces insectorum RCEF 264 TaxID=1081102 RepID=A0A167UJ28_9HYPO|nr:protein efr3 [Niveomyces insectorum RCEF 264]